MKTLLTILLLAALPAFADTITTISGTTYSDASVAKTTPTAISITHSTGMAKIAFKDLPAATQKKYGYDPAKAAEYEEQEAQRQAEQNEVRKAVQEVEAKKKPLYQTTPIMLIKSDPKPGVPFWIEAEMQIDTGYGWSAYENARETHFSFTLWTGNGQSSDGYMRREKGEAVRQAIASKGGSMNTIIKAVYLPEIFDAGNPDEFEILEVIEQ
jgi:hypothetical protein